MPIVDVAARFIVEAVTSPYYGEIIYTIDFYKRSGKVEVHKHANREAPEYRGLHGEYSYESVTEFCRAHPVVAEEVMKLLRSCETNIPWVDSNHSTDLIAITTVCSTCKIRKEQSRFPRKISFQGHHTECCECRIKYCQEHGFKCESPIKDSNCVVCLVRKHV